MNRNILKLNKTCMHIIMCTICIWIDIFRFICIFKIIYSTRKYVYIYTHAIYNYMYIYKYIYTHATKIQTWREIVSQSVRPFSSWRLKRFLRGATSLTASFLDSFILAMTCFSFSSRFLIAGWQSWDFSNNRDLTWLAYQPWWLSRYWKLVCKIL